MNDNVKGWIFVSHSNKDIDAVRRVRDFLESKNHHPLLFFLKCLRDTDELDSLIIREIEARTIFLLCESPNARSAAWVQREVEFIKSLPDRHYAVVDLDSEWPVQQSILEDLSRQATLFLSYNHADHEDVCALYEELRGYDYSTFFDRHNLSAGDDFQHRIEKEIKEAAARGFFVFFASPASFRHRQSFQYFELNTAFREVRKRTSDNHFIVPCLIGDPLAPIELPASLAAAQFLDLRGLSPRDQAQRLHHALCQRTNQDSAGERLSE